MFTIALGFPDQPTSQDIDIYSSFYMTLNRLVPCNACRQYTKHVIEPTIPLDFSGKKELLFSLYSRKTLVNAKLGKPNATFEQVLDQYTKLFAKSCHTKSCD